MVEYVEVSTSGVRMTGVADCFIVNLRVWVGISVYSLVVTWLSKLKDMAFKSKRQVASERDSTLRETFKYGTSCKIYNQSMCLCRIRVRASWRETNKRRQVEKKLTSIVK
jgi:hypothetical protein